MDNEKAMAKAVLQFWETRHLQRTKGNGTDNRPAVLAGKQLDGFVEILKEIAHAYGVPDSCVHTRQTTLPGYFRATKNWDMVVLTPKGTLVAAIELKSQVGSFGNNFNNRVEEAVGSATDLWTAFREATFPAQPAPWIGYFLIVEDSASSRREVQLAEPYFCARAEFNHTSYIERYAICCRKLLKERLYTSVALLTTRSDGTYACPPDLSAAELFKSFGHQLQYYRDEFDAIP